MKKKRMVTALLTTAMVFGAVPTAFAADNITVTVDGQKVSFGDQQPEYSEYARFPSLFP